MNIVFLGTPEFSIPSLNAIYESKHNLIAIVSQPDRVQSRGNKIIFSPVKEFAIKHNIPIFQFEKISRDGVEALTTLNPDLMVTASYGQILSQQVIDIPKYGIINVHASLLPNYRGASPIQSAIIKGETKTGVTIMRTEAGLDTGDIIDLKSLDILPNETAGELSNRLATLGAELLLLSIDKIENGSVEYEKQPHIDTLVTRRINKEDGKIVWEKSAKQIKCQILGMNPSPIAFSYLNGEVCKIYRAEIYDGFFNSRQRVGAVLKETSLKEGILVQCGEGILKLTELQLPNSRIMSAKDFINGRKIKIGDIFNTNLEIVAKSPIVISNNKQNEDK